MPNMLPCIADDRTRLQENSREAHQVLRKADLTKEVLYGTTATPENSRVVGLRGPGLRKEVAFAR